ncbi:hypothetical protein AB9P05_14190 [Roseivirga sp. BDSF3-8]|uniref:hypothetical protein n=1 Tax=Roseivirga sp. BDSF3-8 TaxID=3241598 RepID=UPI003531FC81
MRLPNFLILLLAVALFSCDEDSIQPGPEGRYNGTTDQGEPVTFRIEEINDELFITSYSITILYAVGGGNTETEVIAESNANGLGELDNKAFTIYQNSEQSYPIQGFQESNRMISGTYILKALLMQDDQPEVVSGTFRATKVDQD